MPIIQNSTYQGPPPYYFNGHFETVIPSLFRKIQGVSYLRERIETPNNDFLDLDWSKVESPRLWLVSHGLEGNSTRHYSMAIGKLFNAHHFDV
ncbi:hypothetical protein ACFFUR_12400 [Echinicola jeungdonensis]|uniref:Alpha/beta hydrolase n=1 Tax=Echinicola jeungdonensis TaxID=709343 RepID=A0ABV5J708_9BACT